MSVYSRSVCPVFAVVMLLIICVSGQARFSGFQEPQEPERQPTQDPVTQLRLTPEQRQKIRAIREQKKDERAAINQRLRESNAALEQALDADNPNENDVEQRLRDVAESQAAATRMRVMTELRIRRLLTPEQLSMWRLLRQQAAAERRQRANPRPDRPDLNGLTPNQRNGIAPFPGRNAAPRTPRP